MNHNIPSFRKTNLQNIKIAFEEKTGVNLNARKPAHRPIKTFAVLAAVLVFSLTLTAAAFAMDLFSPLSGDDLALNATYDGKGIVSVQVENKSDKGLLFQPTLKLMLWSSGEEVQPISDEMTFSNTEVPAHSTVTMTIDLSRAYDIAQLEQPLTDDSYYLVLTNNNFIFGQDWICTIKFAQNVITSTDPLPQAHNDEAIVQQINDALQFYFETFPDDPDEQALLQEEYVQTYSNLFTEFEGNIVSSVSPSHYIDITEPVIFDDTVSPQDQGMLWNEQRQSVDMNKKLLATSTETALTISAMLPSERYDDSFVAVPLFYVFAYEKDNISSENDYAFVYGQIESFSDLAKYKVYEDEQYVFYEVSALVYSDVDEHIQNFLSQNPNTLYNDQIETRVKNIYSYFKNNMSDLFLAY